MEETLIEKACRLLVECSDSNYRISKSTGISDTTIERYRKGGKPTPANANILLQYLSDSEPILNGAKMLTNFNYAMIPFIPIHAQGGYSKGYGDLDYIERLPTYPVIIDKSFRGKYRVFEVEGDSMDNGSRTAIFDGDKILGKEVKRELWKGNLHINDSYFVFVLKEDGITVKKVISHDMENGIVKCHPLNPLFDDFDINLSDTSELYKVDKIVERNIRL